MKHDSSSITPCDVIFNVVEKPSDYLFCKSMNVYDNKWRVNIYSKRQVDGIDGMYISKSYFTSFDSDTKNLSIIF
jgi:hypothetical protein